MKITNKLFMATALASVVLTGLFGQPTFADSAKGAKSAAAIAKRDMMRAKFRAENAARMQRFAAAKAAQRAKLNAQANAKETKQDSFENAAKARQHHAAGHKK